jgi:hypothetical protein
MIERKGIDAVRVPNYARLIFSSNHGHVLRIDVSDRGYCACHVVVPDDMVGPVGADKRRAYFVPIVKQTDNGGAALRSSTCCLTSMSGIST